MEAQGKLKWATEHHEFRSQLISSEVIKVLLSEARIKIADYFIVLKVRYSVTFKMLLMQTCFNAKTSREVRSA